MKSGKPLLSSTAKSERRFKRVGPKSSSWTKPTFGPMLTPYRGTGQALRGKWVLRGEPALVDSTSPRWGEKACYYSGVCLESGEVEAMEMAGNSAAETSTAFLRQLRENHPGPLVVIDVRVSSCAGKTGPHSSLGQPRFPLGHLLHRSADGSCMPPERRRV